jgi:hypothetical protein
MLSRDSTPTKAGPIHALDSTSSVLIVGAEAIKQPSAFSPNVIHQVKSRTRNRTLATRSNPHTHKNSQYPNGAELLTMQIDLDEAA